MAAPNLPYWQVEVAVRPGVPDPQGQAALAELRAAGIEATHVEFRRGYLLHGSLAARDAERAARELLADPVSDTFAFARQGDVTPSPEALRLDVARKPGVMDPVAGSVVRALAKLGIAVPRVATFRSYRVKTTAGPDALRAAAARTLANETIEEIHVEAGGPPAPVEPAAAPFRRVEVRLRDLDDEALLRMSRDRSLSLSLVEMRAVRDHYRSLEREPTDLEIETIAQTWSEHCKHKTLRGPCEYREGSQPVRRIESILGETIVKATETVRKDWCLSVFVDNAGVIALDESTAVCFKVETHNHPSAIEPFGGAGTGIGGVIRDVVGTGTGAKPIASTDVFCVGPLDTPEAALPKGALHPRRILKGVVAGVRDYGNPMGIPTVNGGVFVDEGYVANPLVFCGTVGLLPRDAVRKEVKPGDAIVLVGGRTGRDGIHGATFSSAELHEESQVVSSTAVQIGDPITEKKATEAILRARQEKLIRSLTDCGAGGLSSAVGELGEACGAEVHLERVPLKYAGLRYDEIWISEAQERMVVAAAPANVPRILEICREEQVEAIVLGSFTDTKKLVVKMNNVCVGELDVRFLHKGVPRVVRQAVFEPFEEAEPDPPAASELERCLLAILRSPNVASKEWIIRQYDHEVQGRVAVKPLTGPRRDGPSDAAVIAPVYGSTTGVVLACGLNPRYGKLDPASLAECAIDEALRNAVAVGGDPDRTAILDNYCWGNCDKPDRLGGLVRCSEAARDLAISYETPFISGKDSLANEYRVGGESIPIPPTFLVSAISVVADVSRCVTMDAKRAGSALVLVGITKDELGGSHLHLVRGAGLGRRPPRVDPSLGRAVLRCVARAISEGIVSACHDLSEGGLAVAAAEMATAGNLGLTLDVDKAPLALGTPDRLDVRLFSESASRFLLEVAPENLTRLKACLLGVPHAAVGTFDGGSELVVRTGAQRLFSIPVASLREAFLSGFDSVAPRSGSA